MVKLEKLKPFTFYRLTSPVVMPYGEGNNRKKGLRVSVLAPSIDDELRWLKNENGINPAFSSMRLYKYFIEKTTEYKFFQQPVVKTATDADGSLSAKVLGAKINVIEDVVSYRSGYKSNMLKGFNTLYEINHISERVLTNPKDKRRASVKSVTLCNAWSDYLKKGFVEKYFTLPGRSYVVVPVNLWLDESEYKSPTLFSVNSDKMFGHIANHIGKVCTNVGIDKFAEVDGIILVNKNEVMILNNAVPEKSKPDLYLQAIKTFLKKCRSFVTAVEEQESPEIEEYLQSANAETARDMLVDDTLLKYGVSEDKLDTQTREKVIKAVEKTIENKETPPTTRYQRQTGMPKVDTSATGLFPSEQEPSKEELFKKELGSLVGELKKEPELDIVVEARLAGQSVENMRRNKLLREKYSTLKFNGDTLESLTKAESELTLPDISLNTTTVNPAMNNIKSANFEKVYNEKLMMYDFASVLTHFANAKPALYLIGDPIIEDISDATAKLYRVTVEYEDENRKRSKFSFKMPKMYQEKYLFLNEQKWNIIHQKVPYPVTKTSANLSQVSTNYKKIRMSRFGNNVSAKVTKLKKILLGKPIRGVRVVPGNTSMVNNLPDMLTTIEYDELGTSIVRLDIGKDTRIHFALSDAVDMTKIMGTGSAVPAGFPSTCVPIGVSVDRVTNTKTTIYLDGMTNKVYLGSQSIDKSRQEERPELSDFIIGEIMYNLDKTAGKAEAEAFQKEFDDLTAGTKFMYTRAKIMDENIPLVFVLGAGDPGGLQAVLEKAKIKYQFVETRPTRIDKNNQGVVAFSDGYLIFDRYPYENSLLLNGLSVYPMKEISYYDMASRDTYVDIFDSLFNRRTLIDGIENFYYLLIDPITFDVLERLHLPTQFTELLLYANGLLADNTYQIDSDYHQSRLRSNEIINVYLYEALCDAYAAYKYGRAVKFSIQEDAVIKALLASPIVDSHSKLNMTLELENDRQVKLKGPGGMNVDRALTIEKRAYHPTMQGVIGINSTPSGEVGINRHMSLNANIKDARGFIEIERPKNGGDQYDGTEIMTPGELLNTFACESADVERVAMAISQAKHLVPTASSGPSLVNYDMERVAPHLSNDFAFVAKQDGKVVALDQGIMVVQYKDGTYDDIDIAEHADKNTDGGFFIMNKLDPEVSVGATFKKNDIIASDRKYVSKKDAFGDNAANIGTLARVAIVANGGVYEDACYLTNRLANKLATKITKEKIVTVSKYTNIKYIAKKGQHVNANDPILVFDDTQDEFTSQMLAAMAEETDDTGDISATTAPVVTKVAGTVTDVKVYYTVPIEELSPSLKKIVQSYTKETGAREKFLAQYIDPKNANTILAPSEQMIPDSVGRVGNIKVGEGVIIKIYVEYLDVMGVADKLTNSTQGFVIH